jgi:superfamily I DNA/RNA helicase
LGLSERQSSLARLGGVSTLRRLMPDLRLLNPQQREAVETLCGPVLILAGAGTGKTRVITHRIAHLMQSGVAPAEILAVTFTNKAAREMKSRLGELVHCRGAVGGGGPTVCTFHSLCVRILRRHAERLGYKRNFVIYDEAEQLGTIRKILSRISEKGVAVEPGAVLAMLSRYRNGGGWGAGLVGVAGAMAERIRRRYESALRACNAMDFDDLILHVLRLFSEHPVVLEECRARYRQVMVDEYQDTNAAQFRLVHALTREHRNLCVVGDDDQSIYGWRGAEIANLLEMETHYPEVKVIRLEQNYRSTGTILEAANAVIRNNLRRRGKRLWSAKGQGAKLVLQAYEHEEEEARGLVDQIEFDRVARGIGWSEQAVLFRTNGQSRPIETALRQAGVRYHLVGGQSFFDRREVRDVLAYLKVMLNPHDDISLLRIANVPARGLSEVTMERLLGLSHERKCSVYAVMERGADGAGLTARGLASLREFVGWIESTRSAVDGGAGFALAGWAEGFLRGTGYLEELRRSEKAAETGENRVRNVIELVRSLDDGDSSLSSVERLSAFLEEVMLDQDREEEKETAGDRVTLITMHSCKGLEFPYVHLVGLEEGLLPHSRSIEDGTLDEERRLFYVAITRAMKGLSLSWCGARRKYGQRVPGHPSRFLKELPAELVEDGAGRRPVSPEAGRSLFAGLRALVEGA